METLLADFRLDRTTWFYLTLLLITALYLRFGRIGSLRNLDLALLLSLSPGLLFVDAGSRLGYVWLFAGTAAIVVRLLTDGFFVRRPRLAQNLNTPGLAFLLAACGAFHAAEIFTADRLPDSALRTREQADRIANRRDPGSLGERRDEAEPKPGPTAAVIAAPAVRLSAAVGEDGSADLAVRITASLAHAAVVTALLVIGWRSFGDPHLGVAMATLYLLLPCTAYHVAQVNHVLPAALILWAFIAYRNPYASGGLLGLACGTYLFLAFLLPLWATFYGRRNAARFGAALAAVWLALLGSFVLTAADAASFHRQVVRLADFSMLRFGGIETTGVWAGIDGIYRLPVFVLYLIFVGMLSRWPKARTLDVLLARSAAVIAGTQFWFPYEGGVYLLWYVPLFVAVVFRPDLSRLTPPDAAAWPWRRVLTPPADVRPTAATIGRTGPLFR